MSSSSSSSLFCFFLFSSLILFHVGVHGVSLIEETCKKLAAHTPNLKYEFCVASLQADPKSQTADLQGLGLISMELTQKNATYIDSRIKTLMHTAEPMVKKYLDDCSEFYSDSLDTIDEALQAFQSKDYSTAQFQMSAVLDVSVNCEDGFKERELTSPVSKEDDNFLQLSAMSLTIIVMLKN